MGILCQSWGHIISVVNYIGIGLRKLLILFRISCDLNTILLVLI